MSWLSIMSGLVYDIREAMSKNEHCDVSDILDLKYSPDLYTFLIRSTSANLIEYTYILLAIINTKGEKYTPEFVREIFLPLCGATIDTSILSQEQLISIWRRNISLHYDGKFPKSIKDTMLSITNNGNLEPFELDIFTRIAKIIISVEMPDQSVF